VAVRKRVGLRSGELSRQAGVSADTLRHYERRGLLQKPPRRPNGYRVYGPESLERVRLIQRGLSLGFTLTELAVFLRERDAGRPPCGRVRAVAGERLAEVERRIEELARFRDELREVIREWDRRLTAGSAGGPKHFLETDSSKLQSGAPAVAGIRFSRRAHRSKE
jgi:DNA-binding transcriptional MerR regulator